MDWKRRTLTLFAAVLLALAFAGATPAGKPSPIESAVAGAHRSEENRARDAHRHPTETLTFFGLEPQQTVIEISPGTGWYTEVLAPVVKGRGKLVLATFDPDPKEGDEYAEYRTRVSRMMREKFERAPEIYGEVESLIFEPPETLDLTGPDSADLIVTFRNTHNWIQGGVAEQVFAAFHRTLKPGGTLGVVQHRAPRGADPKKSAERGYVPQADLIALAEAAGFKLEASSEVNANPKDTKDHPDGVWDLPPTLMGKEEDRDRYLAIGESDRMTLRFVKRK